MPLKPAALLVAVVAGFLFPGRASAHPHHETDPPDSAHVEIDPQVVTSAQRVQPEVTIETQGDRRIITANGLPDHATGRFPNRHNPHAVRPQRYRFEMPLTPERSDAPTDARGMPFGVAINGVPFDPGTAENWTPHGLQRGGLPTDWTYEALGGAVDLGVDPSNAHVQPSGAYHYHGVPHGLLQRIVALRRAKVGPVLLGYAADGFPIYHAEGYVDPQDAQSNVVALRPSYRLKQGQRPDEHADPPGPGGNHDGAFAQDYEYVEGLGDLDECNGRFAVTPEYPEGTYHYMLTDAFPFVPRMFRGTPDDSFRRRGPGPNNGERDRERRNGRGDRPPPDRRQPPPPR